MAVSVPATETSSLARRQRFLHIDHGYGPVALVGLCAFGPYLSESVGVRTEQIALFLLVLVAVPGLISTVRYSDPALLGLLCLAGVFGVGAVTASFKASISDPDVARASLLAGAVNNLIPIAAILLTTHWLSSGRSRESVFRLISRIVVGAMMTNSVVAIISTKADLIAILRHFYQASTSVNYENSVAVRSAAQGRYTGIFDQPAQAGIMYSLALFCAIYLLGGRAKGKPLQYAVVGTLLVAGGFMTVSKNFIFLGFPLATLMLLRRHRTRARRLRYAVGGPLVLGLALFLTGQLSKLPGVHQFGKLLAPFSGTGSVTLYTGGRLGSNGSLASLFHLVSTDAPVGGFGLAGLNIAYDSLWGAVAVTAGYLGVALYLLLFLLLVARYFHLRRADPTDGFMFSLVALIIGSSIGFPILTGNRISTLLWILLTTLLLSDGPWNPQQRRAGEPRLPVREYLPPRSKSIMAIGLKCQNRAEAGVI